MAQQQQLTKEELEIIRDALVCTIACLDRESGQLRHEYSTVLKRVDSILNE